MMEVKWAAPCLSLLFFLIIINSEFIHGSVVTYDRKAIVINGQKRLLFSGSIHYPRSTPEMWEDLILKAKEGGLDVIETYVFWNVHEPYRGQYKFEGRYDLVRFVRTIQEAGLYAHLRIGPYVCAEWNFGGFPVWLKYVPGISFRTDNEPFKLAMKGFTEMIVNLMKSNKMFASQGGPIILTQIENEYGSQGKALGSVGNKYANWAANMALQTDTGVPWVMCKQDDAPDPIINSCNGFYCDEFTPNKPYKPTIWTENWTGWFSLFGGANYKRPAQDMAFSVANFIQKGGSLVNYYMYHGGTNFGRTAGGPFITTSYDYDAPLDEFGLFRNPKYGHLKELHRALKLCEKALVSSDPTVKSLGPLQQSYTYVSRSGQCAAFLSNFDEHSAVRVMYNNMHYKLSAWSISILPDCKTVVFNTAQVGAQTAVMGMLPTTSEMSSWEFYREDVFASGDLPFSAYGLLEQINVTRDRSDYLWYRTSVHIDSSESFLRDGKLPALYVKSEGHALLVFVNGKLSGSASGTREFKRFIFVENVELGAGTNTIALLSVAVGLQNIGSGFETRSTGISPGPVLLYGLDSEKLDLSHARWTYQVGLTGEAKKIFSPRHVSSVGWKRLASVKQTKKPLTWYKAYFNEPSGDEPLALDMNSMGKGQVWINGQSIGRYWTAKANGNCTEDMASYAGRYKPQRNQVGCGHPTQRMYHVPRSWLQSRNLLVVFEEHRGDPSRITLVKRSIRSVCADVSEFQPNMRNMQIESSGRKEKFRKPKLRLDCGRGQYISSIQFASFGTPLGTCGEFYKGHCHATSSYVTLKQKCQGKPRCSVTVANWVFGDPCADMLKSLKVEATCSPSQ